MVKCAQTDIKLRLKVYIVFKVIAAAIMQFLWLCISIVCFIM